MREQEISVPLPVGAIVEILEDVEMEENADGFASSISYRGTVEQHVPDTGLIRMSDGTQRAELQKMMANGDGVLVICE